MYRLEIFIFSRLCRNMSFEQHDRKIIDHETKICTGVLIFELILFLNNEARKSTSDFTIAFSGNKISNQLSIVFSVDNQGQHSF